MPNLKIYVDEEVLAGCRHAIPDTLLQLRNMLEHELDAPAAAFQIAVIPVLGMPDLTRVNVEMNLMPSAQRTRENITAICAKIQAMLEAAIGHHVAVRVSTIDRDRYVSLK